MGSHILNIYPLASKRVIGLIPEGDRIFLEFFIIFKNILSYSFFKPKIWNIT